MNKEKERNDSTLVQMALLGDNKAFEVLVARHERAVMGTALKVTENKYSAEDASQDAFVSAYINLSALREGDKFSSWVCTIAKNHARTLSEHYRSAIPEISLGEFENYDFSSGFEDDFTEKSDLHEMVNALSEKIREAIKMHYFDGYSVKEIASALLVSEGTVKWRLSEGRKQLRKGYGVMENTYSENETIFKRVMRQVEALKLWRIKENKEGFEAEYRAILDMINSLPDSKEKSYALAETLQLGT